MIIWKFIKWVVRNGFRFIFHGRKIAAGESKLNDMKKFIVIVSIAIMAACGTNDDNASKAAADSSTATNTETNTHGNLDDAATSGKTMMQMMQENMDQMKVVQSTGNPDNDFAALMKVHHMGALQMAQVEIAQGTDTEIKQMAQKMINDQQNEIAELNTFLSGHQAHGGGDAFYKEVIGPMNNMKMETDHSGSIDRQFVQMMIPHHQGAIDMARAYIKAGAHEAKLKTMANNIIASQQKEIQQLQNWLAKH
jgi:uncharacterized protein (DUF305 family)